MLSSLILSFAMSAAPAPAADINVLPSEEISRPRRSVRLDAHKLTIDESSRPRRSVRLDSHKLTIDESSRPRRSVRL